MDKKGQGCSVHDVAIHPNYVKTLKEEPAFMNFFLQVVFEGLTAKFSVSSGISHTCKVVLNQLCKLISLAQT